MTWSNIAKRNASKTLEHSPKKIEKKEVKNDYWNDSKYDCSFKTVEQQISESYKRLGFEPPKSIYGRAGLLDYAK